MVKCFVTIIIPSYNDWERLPLCIKAISMQTYPKELFHVIIVNNNPCDKVPTDLFLPENFQLITESKPGSYAARNTALKIAEGEIIGFTDSDCIPDKEWIRNAVYHFNSDSTCARIAGKILVFPKTKRATVAGNYDKLYAFRQKEYVELYGTSVTGNLFTRKYVFDAIGPFNDTKMSFSDFVWGSKAQRAGYRIDYMESVLVKHPARNLSELIKKEKRLAGGREKIAKQQLDKFAIYCKFLDEIRPRIRGEYKYIMDKGTFLTSLEKLSVMLLRIRLIYVRAYENMNLRLGKKPDRF